MDSTAPAPSHLFLVTPDLYARLDPLGDKSQGLSPYLDPIDPISDRVRIMIVGSSGTGEPFLFSDTEALNYLNALYKSVAKARDKIGSIALVIGAKP